MYYIETFLPEITLYLLSGRIHLSVLGPICHCCPTLWQTVESSSLMTCACSALQLIREGLRGGAGGRCSRLKMEVIERWKGGEDAGSSYHLPPLSRSVGDMMGSFSEAIVRSAWWVLQTSRLQVPRPSTVNLFLCGRLTMKQALLRGTPVIAVQYICVQQGLNINSHS